MQPCLRLSEGCLLTAAGPLRHRPLHCLHQTALPTHLLRAHSAHPFLLLPSDCLLPLSHCLARLQPVSLPSVPSSASLQAAFLLSELLSETPLPVPLPLERTFPEQMPALRSAAQVSLFPVPALKSPVRVSLAPVQVLAQVLVLPPPVPLQQEQRPARPLPALPPLLSVL